MSAEENDSDDDLELAAETIEDLDADDDVRGGWAPPTESCGNCG